MAKEMRIKICKEEKKNLLTLISDTAKRSVIFNLHVLGETTKQSTKIELKTKNRILYIP